MSPEQSKDEILLKVDQWDLGKTKRRLVVTESWSERLANEVDPIYRRFQVLHILNVDEILVPPPTIDTFWHYHILDTSSYRADCEQAFGGFIDHLPYDPGEQSEELTRLDQANQAKTLSLYASTFGQLTPQAEAIWKTSNPLGIDFEFMDKIGVGNKSGRSSKNNNQQQYRGPHLGRCHGDGPPSCR